LNCNPAKQFVQRTNVFFPKIYFGTSCPGAEAADAAIAADALAGAEAPGATDAATGAVAGMLPSTPAEGFE
jgi:hypothetical protein